MRRLLMAGLGFLACVSLFLQAEQPITTIKDDAPSEYVVKKGDTLWAIAGHFLSQPWQWPEIWHNNPQIENPHLIYPQDTIILSYVNGAPQLSIGKRAYEKRSPAIKEVGRDKPMAPFPTKIINDFLMHNKIQSEAQVEAAPYVMAGIDERLYVGSEDEFYAHGMLSEATKNIGVFRQGDSYLDSDSGEVLGHGVMQIGAAKLITSEKNVAMLKATRVTTAIRRGDLLFQEIRPASVKGLSVKPVKEAIYGKIMSGVESGRTTAGAMDIVALNRGHLHGLEAGNLLDLYISGVRLKTMGDRGTIEAPERRIGSLLVFSVYEKMSHGIILQASQQVISGHIVKNP